MMKGLYFEMTCKILLTFSLRIPLCKCNFTLSRMSEKYRMSVWNCKQREEIITASWNKIREEVERYVESRLHTISTNTIKLAKIRSFLQA